MVLWRPELLPVALPLVPLTAPSETAITLDTVALGLVLANIVADDGRYLVLADPTGDHRLWLPEGADMAGRLALRLPLDEHLPLRLASAQRLHHRLKGRTGGPMPPTWRLTPAKRRRLILMLRALDGHLDGATYRDIATVLLDRDSAQLPARLWKTAATRARAIRLVADAVALMQGGYRMLLRGG
ncbi:DUF2285 domain-containing protein [Niveispirillum sp. KHB5.9]|uniref:DUF2285 domain-containing protein n=1 Tax=Niveispirillum sp. KHB5.9 TaxID=3400269 RepID=UPI003A88817C